MWNLCLGMASGFRKHQESFFGSVYVSVGVNCWEGGITGIVLGPVFKLVGLKLVWFGMMSRNMFGSFCYFCNGQVETADKFDS